MSIRIGGGRGGRTAPSNPPKGQSWTMGDRARQRIDSLIPRMEELRTESIKVDATPLLIWRRGKGSKPCTCSNKGDVDFRASAFNRGPSQLQTAALGNPNVAQKTSQGFSGMDDYATEFTQDHNPFDIPVEPEFDPDFADAKIEQPTVQDSGWLDKVVQEGPFQTGQTIKCGVCFGSSYVDSWKPYKGVRIVGDFSPQTKWDGVNTALDNNATPSVMNLPPRSSVTWKLFIPKFFTQVLRAQVWNNLVTVNAVPQMNVQPITSPGTPETPSWVDATSANIANLQGNGRELDFRLTAVDRDLKFTHFEILILLDEFSQGHIPEIDVPYDSEFVDYNTMLPSVELPLDAKVDEGDIIAENKHGRLWLATSVSKKSLGTGKAYGSDATFRNIHSTEVYWPMNVFRQK